MAFVFLTCFIFVLSFLYQTPLSNKCTSPMNAPSKTRLVLKLIFRELNSYIEHFNVKTLVLADSKGIYNLFCGQSVYFCALINQRQ